MSDNFIDPVSHLTRLITEYLDDGNTELQSTIVDTMKTFANRNFYRQDKESLRSSKEHFESRVIAGEYDSGDEMHGPNNFNKGLGPKYNAVYMYYDSSYFMEFINSYPPKWRRMIMIVLSCEAFKIMCHNDDDDYEEDKTWFIENLAYIISSIIRE
jgi:hypothetical protein